MARPNVSLAKPCLAALLASVGGLLPLAGAAAAGGWQAGTAVVSLTPREPMWLAGYPEDRTRPFDQVTLDVRAKALALQDEAGRRFVTVTLDLHGITAALRAEIARQIADRHGLPGDALLINASHTHCGPEVRDPQIARPTLAGERVRRAAAFRQELVQKVVHIVGEALSRLAPATLQYGQGFAGFAMNRRPDFALPPDHPAHNVRPNPWGRVDHTVPVLRVADPSGRIRAVMFGYACHNTTLNGYQVNGDYAGYAQRDLEQALPGATALFVTGCDGDQNPAPRRSLALAEQHGRTLANAVLAGLALPAAARAAPASVQVGVNLSSFGRLLRQGDPGHRLDPFDLPALVRDELDIRLLDLPSTTLGTHDRGTLARFRARAAAAGCTITNLKVNAHDLPFADRDPAVRGRALRAYRDWIRAAAELGARWLRPYPSATAPDWDILVASYAELAEFASQFKLTLLIENYRWLETEPEAIPRLIRSLGGRIAAAPDTANWADEPTRRAGLRRAFPFAVTADFKVREFAPDGTHPAYDLRAAFQLGRAAGFQGPWCLEHSHADRPTLLRNLRRLAGWLRTWSAAAGPE